MSEKFPPFSGMDADLAIQSITNFQEQEFFKIRSVSDDLKGFLQNCLQLDPKKRYL